jgi:hypothetical protein
MMHRNNHRASKLLALHPLQRRRQKSINLLSHRKFQPTASFLAGYILPAKKCH